MKVFLYGNEDVPIVKECRKLLEETEGVEICTELDKADVAIAPLLQEILPIEKINTPRLGTLIFHPSLLPRHRGADAIKWAFRMGEKYSGATWFWADEGIDTGPICEMEVIAIDEGERPGDYYNNKVIPAAIRLLRYILEDLKKGIVRKRPQIHEYATYERPLRKATV